MLKVKRIIVGQFKTNCYLIIDELGKQCLILDPGDDADYILREVIAEDTKPVCILATHGHFDHLLAVTELKLALNIPFMMQKKDEFLLKRLKSSAAYFLKVSADPPPKIDSYLNSANLIQIGGFKIQVIETPGPTPGSVTFYIQKQNMAFVGDLLFENGGVGRSDFHYSNQSVLNKSINKILNLPDKTILYPGHGGETMIYAAKKFFKNLIQ